MATQRRNTASNKVDLSGMMKGLSGSWNKAKERAKTENTGSKLDDGRYIGRINLAELTVSQSGRPQVHWEYIVLEGEFAGEHHHSWDGMESEDNLKWFARKIDRLGYDPDTLDFTEDEIRELMSTITAEKPVINFRVKTNTGEKGTFVNTYVDGLADYEEPVKKKQKTQTAPNPQPKTKPEPVIADLDAEDPFAEEGAEPEEEPETAEPEEEETVELEPGMKVEWADPKTGKTQTGIFRALSPSGTDAQVLDVETRRLKKVAVELLTVIDSKTDD